LNEKLLTDPEVKALVNTGGRCLIRKDHVFLPFLQLPGQPNENRITRVNRKQLTLLSHLQEGVSIAEAAAKSELSESQAIYFLKRRDVQEWLQNKAKQEAIIRDWTPGKWFEFGQKVLDAPEGVEIPKSKIEVWREFGDRCVPKPSRNGEQTGPRVEININLDEARAALKRQETIEGQIVAEEKAA
jgi:hypothetical protein